ncbi:3-polyprenyl-4-hydroxybenzoate decarboxylase-like protein [Thermoplasmatales archaeon SCGC AB-539-C06]|nr:3-polyprenyl-4-hydroxybenzoate decarboxylase-like protein [Thermoplasmatales archaeon SCGC AB-539-C06]
MQIYTKSKISPFFLFFLLIFLCKNHCFSLPFYTTKKIIETTFEAHKCLKHVFVFDDDIDITNPDDRFWALTTRFQADKDIYTYPNSLGSSLDPSSEHGEDRRKTCKAGFDCTITLSKDRMDFEKVN